MIPYPQSMHRWSSLARWLSLAVGVSMLCASPALAQAETYGELSNFGRAGTGHGQFKIKPGTHAFGVDPTDNSVYVGDELKGGEYRIQKLTAGGVYVAEAVFKAPNHDGIEGIAIDPVQKRVYVLALEKRGQTLTIAPSQPAAGTLYAFSTQPAGEALVPAAGVSEGVLAGPSTLQPQSDGSEVALIEPKGIAVDPTTHDAIILGNVDQQAPEGHEPQEHVALQRIHADGTLGERYVDSTGFFGPAATPNSPVVSPKGAVYVAVPQSQVTLTATKAELVQNELVQIPSDFTSTAPPAPFVQFTLKGTFEEEGHPVVEFDSNEPTAFGGGLSFAPGGEEGTLYARAHIFVGNINEGASYPGVIAFSGADSSEIGWTGGQTKKASESCAISFGGETYSSVAAGGEQKVFMLDPGRTTFPVSPPRVVEFGPGGKGCPPAEATEPLATVNGQPLSASEPVSVGTPVAFSSTLTQANALSVDWSFGDGQAQTESADEYRHTEVTHKFVRGGELTVTETIHTDDLATPTILKQTTVSVSATAAPPTAVLEGPAEVTLGGGAALGRLVYLESGGLGLEEAAQSEEAAFDASASHASTTTGPNRIDAYHWTFGDGESATTATATIKHKYTKAGVYKVELTVTDALGSTSEPSALTIKVNEPAPAGPTGIPDVGGTAIVPPAAELAATGEHPLTPPSHDSQPSAPEARLSSTSLAVSATGAVDLGVSCPVGASSCAGTVTLRTLSAVSVSAHDTGARAKKRKASVLTLASGTFKVAGGRAVSVKLRLSARARLLLAHARALRVRAMIAAHDLAGATHTTQTTVTLHAHRAARGGQG